MAGGVKLEWWTDPKAAAARLDVLTSQWTALSNAALGRGLQPNVDDALASKVGERTAAFRDWRATLGGFENILTWRGPLETWESEANELRGELASRGVPGLPAELEETRMPSGRDVAVLLGGASFAGSLLAFGVVWLLSRK